MKALRQATEQLHSVFHYCHVREQVHSITLCVCADDTGVQVYNPLKKL